MSVGPKEERTNKSAKNADRDFDHGGFWDQYSHRWETDGDGDGIRHEGGDSVLGVEWGEDLVAKRVLDRYVSPHLTPDSRVLEIGPGGGRFSRHLTLRCDRLILADIAKGMLERSASACPKPVETLHLDGTTLRPLKDESLDFVFSYDVFIHLELEEVLRYFAEISRVLKPNGRFVVHTSSLLSRFGWHAMFRQIRDHQKQLGTRYGGRMYPLGAPQLQRMARHLGFAIEHLHNDWEDRDLVISLRRVAAPYWWMCQDDKIWRERVEMVEHAGGDGPHSLFAILDRETGRMDGCLVGPRGSAWLSAAQAVSDPGHACIAKTGETTHWPTHSELRCTPPRGVGLDRVQRNEPGCEFGQPSRKNLVDLGDAVRHMLIRGFVHPTLSPEWILYQIEPKILMAYGFVAEKFHSDNLTAARTATIRGYSAILEAHGHLGQDLIQAAQDLARRPELDAFGEVYKLLSPS